MTNFEKHKNELLEITKGRHVATIALVDGKLTRCGSASCARCEFRRGNCSERFFRWLAEEVKQ